MAPSLTEWYLFDWHFWVPFFWVVITYKSRWYNLPSSASSPSISKLWWMREYLSESTKLRGNLVGSHLGFPFWKWDQKIFSLILAKTQLPTFLYLYWNPAKNYNLKGLFRFGTLYLYKPLWFFYENWAIVKITLPFWWHDMYFFSWRNISCVLCKITLGRIFQSFAY